MVLARRDIEPGLDDVGGQQHVAFAGCEAADQVFQRLGLHPAMHRGNRQRRHMLAQHTFQRRQILDARSDHEALPAAAMLAQQRLPQQRRVERQHVGAHRLAPHRRGGDHADIAQPHQCGLQGARDRRCRHHQRMHRAVACLEPGQPALVFIPEPMLLVDHHQREPGEAKLVGGERLGTNDDADTAIGEALPDGRVGAAAAPPDQWLDAQSGAGEALAEVLQVLSRQHGGGRHHRDLIAGDRGRRGRAQGHFRLAEPDIAAHQPVHRAAGGEIARHRIDRPPADPATAGSRSAPPRGRRRPDPA